VPDGLVATGVTGLEELLRRLDRIPLVLSREVARDGLQAAGEIIQAAAESSAPRRTGELAEDIIVELRVSGDLRSAKVVVGPGYDASSLKTRKRGKYAGQQDTTTSAGVYGGFVERGHGMPGYSWKSRFGSAKQRRRSGREIELGSHDVPPHPWLKPAFDSSSEEAVQVLIDSTKDALQRIDQLVK
jgi:HK97 gp10 family phage protein